MTYHKIVGFGDYYSVAILFTHLDWCLQVMIDFSLVIDPYYIYLNHE